MVSRVLYVSYDGLLDPLGQAQILPYVRALARGGTRFSLLTFEKPGVLRTRGGELVFWRRQLAAEGIAWTALRYTKRPPALSTAWDIARGIAVGLRLARRVDAQVVHARSYVAAVIGRTVAVRVGARFLFDLRGMWPEERVDGGLWPAGGWRYRVAKRVERGLVREADALVTLTERHARNFSRLVTVIPCGVEPERFAEPNQHTVSPGPIPLLIYAGSLGTRYRGDAMKAFAAHRGYTLWVLTGTASALVPTALARAWAGLCFVEPGTSGAGVWPVKVSEYLAAGLPVVVNAGLGDLDDFIPRHRVGVVVKGFDPVSYADGWERLEALTADPDLRARCRAVAREYLSVERGVAQYRALYDKLGIR